MYDVNNRLSSVDLSTPGGRFVIASDDDGTIDPGAGVAAAADPDSVCDLGRGRLGHGV